jgi:hypothetical protein
MLIIWALDWGTRGEQLPTDRIGSAKTAPYRSARVGTDGEPELSRDAVLIPEN